MADSKHLEILGSGVLAWNSWRVEHPEVSPDLRNAQLLGVNLHAVDLSAADLRHANLEQVDLTDARLIDADLSEAALQQADLSQGDLSSSKLIRADLYRASLHGTNLSAAKMAGADLWRAVLSDANLGRADLRFANLSRADLRGADLRWADLRQADLEEARMARAQIYGADLREARLRWANLSDADLSRTNLAEADLTRATLDGADLSESVLIRADLRDSTMTGCRVYGVSDWGARYSGSRQQNLVLSAHNELPIATDGMQLAAFLGTVLSSKRVREAVTLCGKQLALIVGRFTGQRSSVLSTIRDALRAQGLIPIWADSDPTHQLGQKDVFETLCKLSRIIVVDITEAGVLSRPLADALLAAAGTPIIPVMGHPEDRVRSYGLLETLVHVDTIMPTFHYADAHGLAQALAKRLHDSIAPADPTCHATEAEGDEEKETPPEDLAGAVSPLDWPPPRS